MQVAWCLNSCDAGIMSEQNSQGSSTSGEAGAAAAINSGDGDLGALRGLKRAKSGLQPVSCLIKSSCGIGTAQNSQGISSSVGGLRLRAGG